MMMTEQKRRRERKRAAKASMTGGPQSGLSTGPDSIKKDADAASVKSDNQRSSSVKTDATNRRDTEGYNKKPNLKLIYQRQELAAQASKQTALGEKQDSQPPKVFENFERPTATSKLPAPVIQDVADCRDTEGYGKPRLRSRNEQNPAEKTSMEIGVEEKQHNQASKATESAGSLTDHTRHSSSVKDDAAGRRDTKGYITPKLDPTRKRLKLEAKASKEILRVPETPASKPGFAGKSVTSGRTSSGRDDKLNSTGKEGRSTTKVSVDSTGSPIINPAQPAEDMSNNIIKGDRYDGSLTGSVEQFDREPFEPNTIAKTRSARRQQASRSIKDDDKRNINLLKQEKFTSGSATNNYDRGSSSQTERTKRSTSTEHTLTTAPTPSTPCQQPPHTSTHAHPQESCVTCQTFQKPCGTVDASLRDLVIASLRIRKGAKALRLCVRQLEASTRVYKQLATRRAAAATTSSKPGGGGGGGSRYHSVTNDNASWSAEGVGHMLGKLEAMNLHILSTVEDLKARFALHFVNGEPVFAGGGGGG